MQYQQQQMPMAKPMRKSKKVKAPSMPERGMIINRGVRPHAYGGRGRGRGRGRGGRGGYAVSRDMDKTEAPVPLKAAKQKKQRFKR